MTYKRPKGRPPAFRSAAHVCELYRTFCDEIVAGGFANIPSKTAFIDWLSHNGAEVSRSTLYNTLKKHYPTAEREIREIMSDTIIRGCATGKYKETSMIFALKNWCAWSDHGIVDETNGDSGPLEVNISIVDELPGVGGTT